MKSRIILLEPLSNMLDSSSLAKHGNVVVMFGFGVNAAPSVFRTNDFEDAIHRWCRDNNYDPESDAFVVAGRLTKVALALSAIRKYAGDRKMRLMIFDGGKNEYVDKTLAA